MPVLDGFVKKHDYLVCVDSDGCVMDTMNSKHIHCFGPCMVSQWGLEAWSGEILPRWNEINLFQKTRGINRFKGLAMALEEIDKKYTPILGVAFLQRWVNTAPALSDDALQAAVDICTDPAGRQCLEKALAWSKAVNERTDTLARALKLPFPGAADGLEAAHNVADVVVVSSANRDAVVQEWETHQLMGYVDLLLTQDAGSKSRCIGQMLQEGYDPARVLMVGDAPGDLEAAEKNRVWFYPILVSHERESWREFREVALGKLRDGTYGEGYQNAKRRAFSSNLAD